MIIIILFLLIDFLQKLNLAKTRNNSLSYKPDFSSATNDFSSATLLRLFPLCTLPLLTTPEKKNPTLQQFKNFWIKNEIKKPLQKRKFQQKFNQ